MGELRFIAHARARQAARERLAAVADQHRLPHRDRGQQGDDVKDTADGDQGTTA